MRYLPKIYLLTFAMFLPSLTYSKQKQIMKDASITEMTSVAQDSIKTEKGLKENAEDSVKTKQFFNAIDYTLQKRYRTRKFEFKNKNFFDNTYISYNLGVEGFIHRVSDSPITENTLFGISFGKNFTAEHGIRLNVNSGWAYNQVEDKKYVRAGVGIDYMFNLSSYILGYDPSRRFELIPFLGAGYTYTKQGGSAFNVADLHGGLQFKFHIYQNVDCFVEPRITFYTDGIDHNTVDNWHSYDFGYGGVIGMTYRFDDSRRQLKNDKEYQDNKKFFVSLAGGIQYQYSDMVKEMGISNTLGPHAQLSIGKYLSSVMAFRISGFYSTDKWSSKETSINHGHSVYTDYNTTYYGGRAELMFNPLGYAKDYTWAKRFSLSLLGGVEVGGLKKEDIFTDVKSTYIGFTGGIQAKYNFNKNWGIFFEPRMSITPYNNIPVNSDGDPLDKRRHYRDNIYNFNIGVQYDF